MTPLNKEIHNFAPEHFGTMSDFLDKDDSTECDTLMIACSDHGTAPDNVSFAEPGRFFIMQHLASMIPSVDQCNIDSTLSEIEYAFAATPLKHIIVCGHLNCGIIRNFLRPESPDYGGFKEQFVEQTLEAVERNYPEVTDPERTELLIREHVLRQVANLQSYRFIEDRLSSGSLKFHAWIVRDTTARIFSYDPRLGEFVPIEETL